MIVYHLTKRENVESICNNGLLPRLGDNSRSVNDEVPAVWVSMYEDLGFWQLILPHEVVLQLEVDNAYRFDPIQFGYYFGWIYYEPVYIKDCKIVENTPDEHQFNEAREETVRQISRLVLTFVRYYHYHPTKRAIEELHGACMTVYNIMKIISNLKFDEIPADSLRAMLWTYGDEGEYTFLDTYMNTPTRLYEQLLNIEDTSTELPRRFLHDIIIQYFGAVLDTNTGGWTG
ncbi:MAG: hypothetical protein NC548_28500 [Lachnospiraceae bacterium]|nr:hypothetical protein [Lachnospiraceae bacterium]MCM1234119.1 hypothetical protein [Ruminococcus flavefaciens]